MTKIDDATMKEIERLLDEYRRVLSNSPLSLTTKNSYRVHAEYFVRWLADDFEPGAMV